MGSKIAGDVTTKLIERNTTFLMKKGQTFTTHIVRQPGVLIQVFMGAYDDWGQQFALEDQTRWDPVSATWLASG